MSPGDAQLSLSAGAELPRLRTSELAFRGENSEWRERVEAAPRAFSGFCPLPVPRRGGGACSCVITVCCSELLSRRVLQRAAEPNAARPNVGNH